MPLIACTRCDGLNPSCALACMHCGLLLTPPDRGGPADRDRRLPEGDWELAALWAGNQEMSREEAARYRLSVAGEHWVVRYGNLRCSFRVHFEPAASPKAFDLTDGLGQVYRGVYDLNFGELRVCRAVEPGAPRPVALDPHQGVLAVW